jgi:hypothetical protein
MLSGLDAAHLARAVRLHRHAARHLSDALGRAGQLSGGLGRPLRERLRRWGDMDQAAKGRPEDGMKWRVMMELIGSDGTVHARAQRGRKQHRRMLGGDGRADAGGWKTLAGLRGHLIQGHTWEPLRDVRARRLLSLFGTPKSAIGRPVRQCRNQTFSVAGRRRLCALTGPRSVVS